MLLLRPQKQPQELADAIARFIRETRTPACKPRRPRLGGGDDQRTPAAVPDRAEPTAGVWCRCYGDVPVTFCQKPLFMLAVRALPTAATTAAWLALPSAASRVEATRMAATEPLPACAWMF